MYLPRHSVMGEVIVDIHPWLNRGDVE